MWGGVKFEAIKNFDENFALDFVCWMRVNNRRPLANTCDAMCWLSHVTLMFFEPLYLKMSSTINPNILLLDFTFNIFFCLIKYLIIVWLSILSSHCWRITNHFALRSGGRIGLHPSHVYSSEMQQEEKSVSRSPRSSTTRRVHCIYQNTFLKHSLLRDEVFHWALEL